jgi:hypothetical protein
MRIPTGNLIEIRLNNQLVPSNVPLINTEEISLKISSRFDSLVKSDSNDLMNLISNLNTPFKNLGSGVASIAGYQVWKSTEPISFSVEIGFYMRTSGLEDVVKPIQELTKLVVPIKNKDKALTLIAPGPTIRDALKSQGIDTEGGAWNALRTKGNLTLRIGRFIYLESIILISAEPTYSMTMDSEGYPITGKVRMEVSTIDIANTDMINKLTYIPTEISKEEILPNNEYLETRGYIKRS